MIRFETSPDQYRHWKLCIEGDVADLVLAADRSYMLDSAKAAARIALTTLNQGHLPISNGLSRLQSRFLAEPGHVDELISPREPLTAREAESAGLVTFALDDLDYEYVRFEGAH